MNRIKSAIAVVVVSGAAVLGTAVPAFASFYDSRYSCSAQGKLGSWRAIGYDSRGNHTYTGPNHTFKASATNDCINWLSVT